MAGTTREFARAGKRHDEFPWHCYLVYGMWESREEKEGPKTIDSWNVLFQASNPFPPMRMI